MPGDHSMLDLWSTGTGIFCAAGKMQSSLRREEAVSSKWETLALRFWTVTCEEKLKTHENTSGHCEDG